MTGGTGRLSALAITLVLALGGCAGPGGTFPATSECPEEVRAPGTIPQLEALLPGGMVERSPDTVDSGWNCLPVSLATFASHGVKRVQFAGATWRQGGGDAIVAAILSTPSTDPPLEAPWVEEFYETGARSSTKTENIVVDRPTIAGAGEVYRLETLNELSLQTIVVWPAAPYVRVVIVATDVAPDASRADHDQWVEIAVEVAAAVPIE